MCNKKNIQFQINIKYKYEHKYKYKNKSVLNIMASFNINILNSHYFISRNVACCRLFR